MKRIWLLTGVLLALAPLRAQNTNGLYSGTAQTLTYIQSQYVLAPLPSATITVCNYPATQPSPLLPCTNLALLYSGPTTSTPAASAFAADQQGNFSFWALPGYYTYTVTNILTNVTTGPYSVVISSGSSGGGGGGASFPFPGLVFATNSIAGTVATSPQIAAALNTSPSTQLAPSLLPTATLATLGVVRPDGVSITINPSTGVLSSTPPTVSIPSTALVLKGANLPNVAAAASPGTDYVIPSGSILGSAGSLSAASTIPNGSLATTQTLGDNTTKIATDAFVIANSTGGATTPATALVLKGGGSANSVVVASPGTDYVLPSGTVANLSGTPTLPNGTSATTQTLGDNSTKLATTAFVLANGGAGAIPATTSVLKGSGSLGSALAASPGTDYLLPSALPATSSLLKGSGSLGSVSTAIPGTDYQVPGSPVTAKVVNGVSYSAAYTGATVDVRVNACLSDALSLTNGNTTHICNATGESGTQTVAAEIDVGDSAGDAVGLYLPCNASWIGTMTGGTSDIVKQYGGTTIQSVCPSSGPTGKMAFAPGPSSLPSHVFETITSTFPYIYDQGFEISNNVGGHATSSGIGFFLQGPLNDGTTLENVNVYDGNDTYAAEVYNVSSQTTWQNSSINGNNASTGIFILTDGSGSVQAFTMQNFTVVHPGTGKPAILCQDTRSTADRIDSLVLRGVYTESGTDGTTTLVKIDGCGMVQVDGYLMKSYAASSTAPGITVTNSFNTNLIVDNLYFRRGSNVWTLPATAILNQDTGETLLTDALGNFSHYNSIAAGKYQTATLSVSGSATVGTGLTATSDGTHAGLLALAGNTTAPAIPANNFAWLGFNSTSATAYGLQPSTTAPAANQVMAVGAPSSGVAPVTYISNATTVNGQTCTLGSTCTISAGSLPSSTAGQTYYSSGTTGTATSGVLVGPTSGALSGAGLGIGGVEIQAAPFFTDVYQPAGSVAFGASCASGTTASCTITGGAGLDPNGGVVWAGVADGSNDGEFIKYTGATSTTITGMTRGYWGSAAATHGNTVPIQLVTQAWVTSSSTAPYMLELANGAIVMYPQSTQTNNIGNGQQFITANAFVTGGQVWFSNKGGNKDYINFTGAAFNFSNDSGNYTLATGGNNLQYAITTQSITAASLTAITNAVTPIMLANGTTAAAGTGGVLHSDCKVIWSQATGGTVQLGVKASAAPTALWVIEQDSPGAYLAPVFTTITSTTTTATSGAMTPTAFGTTYASDIRLAMNPGISNNISVQLYALTSAGNALTIQPGTGCSGWN